MLICKKTITLLNFLIGFMGCGKTSLSKHLASCYNYNIIETDSVLIEKERKSIDEIFEQKGELFFRKKEEEILKNLKKKRIISIISTGGGLPCFKDNMDILNKKGNTIYIRLRKKTLYNRLRKENRDRPLIKEMTDNELKSFITTELKKREKYYLKAKYIIDADNYSINELSDKIHTFISST